MSSSWSFLRLLSALPLFILPLMAHNSLIVTAEPNDVQPYVIPHSRGFVVQAQDYAVGFPVTNVSTAGAMSLRTLAGPRSDQIPIHYHAQYHETFFVAKGALQLSVQNETRRLGPLDFASVPVNQNHSFKILEPDTEVLGVVAPGGFPFYQYVSTPFTSNDNAPFGPFKQFNLTKLQEAVQHRDYFDYNPTNFSLNFNLLNGTTNPQKSWHTGVNTLPNDTTPYYIAGGWGLKYLHRPLGQVVAVYMSAAESNGRLTLSTVTMQASQLDKTSSGIEMPVDTNCAQLLRVLEGLLFVRIDGVTAILSTGDTAVIPAGHKFSYWSTVAVTRFYTAAAVVQGREMFVQGQRLLDLASIIVSKAET